jgi:hypothetical protein
LVAASPSSPRSQYMLRSSEFLARSVSDTIPPLAFDGRDRR